MIRRRRFLWRVGVALLIMTSFVCAFIFASLPHQVVDDEVIMNVLPQTREGDRSDRSPTERQSEKILAMKDEKGNEERNPDEHFRKGATSNVPYRTQDQQLLSSATDVLHRQQLNGPSGPKTPAKSQPTEPSSNPKIPAKSQRTEPSSNPTISAEAQSAEPSSNLPVTNATWPPDTPLSTSQVRRVVN